MTKSYRIAPLFNNPKGLKCVYCGRKYKSPYGLAKHMTIHQTRLIEDGQTTIKG